MPEEKNTNQPEVPPTTSMGENPKCLCCVPAQPLEPPMAGESLWTCPVEQTKYEYNPADGSVKRVGGGSTPTPASSSDPKTPIPSGGGQPSPEVPEQTTATTTSLFPESPPSRRQRQVNPDKPFSV